ncbi:hypothetical protein [Streptomyces sp. NPDC060027]|uniref:hypothetical protein n=1 Tax=Streptomyces sp. NPDC060027 TaxID=3347040 RepID=UPI0036BD30E0
MPDPSTSRLALYKSLSDGSEDVNYTLDLGQNWDKVDLAVGFQSCTSSTRPSSPYSGKPIMEADTSYRTYLSNGTSPASASWVEIPNSSATFNNTLKMSAGKQVNIGASGSTASFVALLPTATGDWIVGSRVTADSVSRFTIRADGRLDWGSGSATQETNLYRSAANTLKTDDNLIVDLNLTVNGVGQNQYIAKTADETVTSNATLQNDDHLVLPVVANAVYTFALDLYMTEATDFVGDFKMSFTCPASATFDMHGVGPHATSFTTGTSSDGEWIGKLATSSAGATLAFGVGTGLTAVRVYGRLVTLGTAGNFTLQWAQNASDASGTTLKAGSFMTMTRVA